MKSFPRFEKISAKWIAWLNLATIILVFLVFREKIYDFPYLVAVDLPFTAWYIFVSRRTRPEGAIFFTVISYYTYVFGLKQFFGLMDISSITVISNLKRLGLEYPQDLNRYLFVSVVLKTLMMLFFEMFKFKKFISSRITVNARTIFVFAALTGMVGLLSGNGVANDIFEYCTIFLAFKIFLSFPNLNFWKKTSLLFIGSAFLIFLTRSRIIIGALLLLFYWQELTREKFRPLRLMLFSVFGLALLLAYSSFRSGGLVYLEKSGLNARQMFGADRMDESEMIYLFGSHLIGLSDRGQLPAELRDGLLDKLERAIPAFPWKNKALADRYVGYYFRAAAQNGGGWAFSSVAEWYLFAGWVGIFIFALASAYVLAFLESRNSDEFMKVLFIVFSLRFVRSESSVIYYYVIVVLLFRGLLLHGILPFRSESATRRKLVMNGEGAK